MSTPILNSVRVSTSQAGKASLIMNDGFKSRLNEIEKCIETPVMMLGMTGFSDYRELCSALFHTLALLEMQAQAAMEVE